MKIAVVGPGAVGGYFGARLAEAGNAVTFLARGRTLEALRTQGLRVTSLLGNVHLEQPDTTDDLGAVGTVDLVLVCVKSWQVAEVAPTLGPLMGDSTCVLPLQNGVEAVETLVDSVGRGPVLGGICKVISRIDTPGHILHLGADPTIEFGEVGGTTVSERVEAIARTFEGAGIVTQRFVDARVAIWGKFLFIAVVSGLGAVTRADLGALRSLPETRRMLVQGMDEVIAVARGQGVELAPDIIERTLDFIDSLPADSTASMQRDLMAGRPSELEAQNGAVVRLGARCGVDTPLHRFIHHSLLPMERAARGQLADGAIVQ